MAYANSIRCVKKVIAYLEIIIKNASNEQPITTLKTDESIKLCAQLREAKAFLKKINHAEYNHKYTYLDPIINYSFKAYPTYIVAKHLVPIAVEEIPLFQPVHRDIVNNEAQDSLEAIAYLMEHKNLQRVIFPAMSTSTALERWCVNNNYSWSRGTEGFIVENNEGVAKIIK